MSEQTNGASCSHWVQVRWPYRGFDSGLWFNCCSLCGHITDQDFKPVKIVPADAVAIDRAVADTAAEACEQRAGQYRSFGNATGGHEKRGEAYANANRLAAAAAALRGGGEKP